MKIGKTLVGAVSILALVGMATAPAMARKHHKSAKHTQTMQMNHSGGATNKESSGMGSSGSGPSAGPSGQSSQSK